MQIPSSPNDQPFRSGFDMGMKGFYIGYERALSRRRVVAFVLKFGGEYLCLAPGKKGCKD